MKDIYTESIVPIVPRKQDVVLKYTLLGLLAGSVILMFFVGIIGLIAAAVFALLLNGQLTKTDGEYEYVHTNDVFDVDVVIRNSKRKQLTSINLNYVELVAPADSNEVRAYGQMYTVDYSGNSSLESLYAVICKNNGKLQKIVVQMDEQMRRSLRLWIPDRVI